WLFVGSALPALAHPVSDWELKNLPRFPSALADSLAAPGLPDSAGLVGPNRTGWRHVAYQRPALWALRLAAARGDEVLAERAWPAGARAVAPPDAGRGLFAGPPV